MGDRNSEVGIDARLASSNKALKPKSLGNKCFEAEPVWQRITEKHHELDRMPSLFLNLAS